MNAAFLERQLNAYLSVREALGFQMTVEKTLLPEFVAFVHAQGITAPISAQLALAWACQASSQRGQGGSARRLGIARQFLLSLQASVPEIAVPEPGLLPAARRSKPFIFSPAQVIHLIDAARASQPRNTLRPQSLSTLIGLLASTGLRSGEAFRLQIRDVKLDPGPPQLFVLQTKFKKSRIVPLHSSTAEHLRCYIALRDRLKYDALSEALLVSEQGRALNQQATQRWFQRLCQRLAIQRTDQGPNLCLTSFRHTFAVTCLRRWYQQGCDVQSLLPRLSVYLGHIKPQTSYWYLTAVPELLDSAAQRFRDFALDAGDDHAS